MPTVTSYPAIVSDSNSPVSGIQAIVDPGGSLRTEIRPADHTGAASFVGGHYAVAQRSGSIVATIGAAGHLARIRWTDATRFLVLHRIKVGVTVDGGITTATELTLRAIVVRGFSVDFTTAITQVSMAGVTNTNKMRASMSASLMGTAGPGICTTTVMSGQTLTADAAPFAVASLPGLLATNSTGVAVAVPVGFGTSMVTLYEWTGLGQYPVVLAANEGVVIQPHVAGPATGTFALYTQWEWAEVAAF